MTRGTAQASTDGIDPRAVMLVFAQYGFRKTSMEDIARAANLSRQSIYKKFGSKEACYDAILRAYLANIYESVFTLFDTETEDPLHTLEQVFDTVSGDSLEFARTPHGTELMETALRAAASWPENWPQAYQDRLAGFLCRHGFAATEDRCADIAHVLITAARGALITAPTHQAFCDDMRRIFDIVLPCAA
jgi:AcrR family transcriptional regulator